MRLRITRALSGSIDGIHLSHFVVGHEYDVGTSVGSFLLSVGAAEPASQREDSGERQRSPVAVRRDKARDREPRGPSRSG